MTSPVLKTTPLLFLGFLLTWPATPAVAQEEDYDLFRSRGYAQLFAVNDDELLIFQETADSLILVEEGVIAEDVAYTIGEDAAGESFAQPFLFGIEETESGFSAREADGTFRAFDVLPEAPPKPIFEDEAADPELNFEVFWQLVSENYAYFDLSGVDWQEVYASYRPRVDGDTAPEELFDLLAEMLDLLQDGHNGKLTAEALGLEYFSNLPRPSWWMIERIDEMVDRIAEGTDHGLRQTGNGRMLYGTFDDGRVGYLNILGFFGYSEDLLTDTEVFAAALDQTLAELSGTEALVLDLRWNLGGFAHLPLVLVRRFTESERLAHSKQARSGEPGNFTAPEPIVFGPEGTSYLGRPVVTLITDLTLSAGDVAAGTLGELPNVTLVGRPSWGGFSNAQDLVLPNGWRMTLTNERYLWGPEPGVDLERIGVAPDLEVLPDPRALDAGHDNVLERALLLLEERGGDCEPSAQVLCLGDGRFQVEVAWRDFDGNRGDGQAEALSTETGSFWFFDSSNVELLVKVLDGRQANGHFWVLFGSLSNVAFTLTVTDLETGTEREYRNPLGSFASGGDNQAFPE